MTDYPKALAALREARDENASIGHEPVSWFLVDAALAALDAARGEAVAWKITLADNTGTYDYAQWAGLQAPQAPPAAVPAGYVPVPVEPTQAMLNAARDWSLKKYGQAVGNDGARGCYAAMLAAAKGAPDA